MQTGTSPYFKCNKADLVVAIIILEENLQIFRENIRRKMAAQYPDGSRDDMVNANTDVLPMIDSLKRMIIEHTKV